MERITSLESELKVLRGKKESLTAEFNSKKSRLMNAGRLYVQAKRVFEKKSNDRLKLRELIRQFIRTMIVDPVKRTAVFTTIAGNTREITWEGRSIIKRRPN